VLLADDIAFTAVGVQIMGIWILRSTARSLPMTQERTKARTSWITLRNRIQAPIDLRPAHLQSFRR